MTQRARVPEGVRMRSAVNRFLWVASVAASLVARSGAAVLITEDFSDYGTVLIDPVNGLNGGDGWAGAWTAGATGPAYEPAERTKFANPGYLAGNNEGGADDGRAGIYASDSTTALANRTFASGLTGTIWLSALVRHVSNTSGDILFWLDTGPTYDAGSRTMLALRFGDVPSMRYANVNTQASDLNSAGLNLLFLAKIVMNAGGGAADSLYFWVKQEADNLSSEAALGAPLLSGTGVDAFGEELNFIGLSGGNNTSNMDAIRFSNGANALREVLLEPAREAIYSTSFDGSAGSLPAGWEVLNGVPGWQLDGTGELDYTGAVAGSLARYAGLLTDRHRSAQLDDFRVEAAFRRSSNYAGLVARLQSAGNYYHARLYQGKLEIYRFDGGAATKLADVVPSDTYNSGETWRVRLMLEGTLLTALVWNELGQLVGRVSVADSTYAAGYAGLRASNPAAYESFALSAIPLPTKGTLFVVR